MKTKFSFRIFINVFPRSRLVSADFVILGDGKCKIRSDTLNALSGAPYRQVEVYEEQ